EARPLAQSKDALVFDAEMLGNVACHVLVPRFIRVGGATKNMQKSARAPGPQLLLEKTNRTLNGHAGNINTKGSHGLKAQTKGAHQAMRPALSTGSESSGVKGHNLALGAINDRANMVGPHRQRGFHLLAILSVIVAPRYSILMAGNVV